MSKTLFQDLLATLKRSNKERKLVLATKAGYKTVQEYKDYLEAQISGVTTTPKKVTKTTKATKRHTIHIVDVIDCSGSMSGTPIRNAVKGINNGINKLKVAKEDVDYTYTLCDFSNDINFPHVMSPLNKVSEINFNSRNSTSLYDAVGKTIEKLQGKIVDGDKVLVNIYTDGEDNSSRTFTPSQVGAKIKSLEGTFTVTFIGTKSEVAYVIKNLKIDESNTLVYDGSAKGLADSMQKTVVARSNYSSNVASGQSVTLGFYKNVVKK